MNRVINEEVICRITTFEQAEAYFKTLHQRIKMVEEEKAEASLVPYTTTHPSINGVVAATIALKRLHSLQDFLVYRFPALLSE